MENIKVTLNEIADKVLCENFTKTKNNIGQETINNKKKLDILLADKKTDGSVENIIEKNLEKIRGKGEFQNLEQVSTVLNKQGESVQKLEDEVQEKNPKIIVVEETEIKDNDNIATCGVGTGISGLRVKKAFRFVEYFKKVFSTKVELQTSITNEVNTRSNAINAINTTISSIKTIISGLQKTITGAASTIVDKNLTANRVAISDGNGKLAASDVTVAQLNILKNSVTGIKGNAETTYRTGNVNITPANIGLGNVNNTADSAKNVNSAVTASRQSISAFNVQTVSGKKQQRINVNTLMAWLINTGRIPNVTNCHINFQTGWSYADNDILQLNSNGTNYELQLAGCEIEFNGYYDKNNLANADCRLRIHASPTTAFSATSGWRTFPVNHIAEYYCNGSGYSPNWKIFANMDDLNSKQNTITGAATTVVGSNLAANRVTISDGNGKLAASGITTTQLNQLSTLSSRGIVSDPANQTAITGRESIGLTLNRVYNNGYPSTYGNALTVGGGGGSQLLLGWNGDTSTGNLYYRSRRDMNNTWAPWKRIAYADELTSLGNNYNSLKSSYNTLQTNYNTLNTNYNSLKTTVTNLQNELNATWRRKIYTMNLSNLSKDNFYPIIFNPSPYELDCEIHSPGFGGGEPYNQNHIHFLYTGQGWSDTARHFHLISQGNYDNNEITIALVATGNMDGYVAVFLRGGFNYTVYSNRAPTLKTTTFKTANKEEYFPYALKRGTQAGNNGIKNATMNWCNNTAWSDSFIDLQRKVISLSESNNWKLLGTYTVKTSIRQTGPSSWIADPTHFGSDAVNKLSGTVELKINGYVTTGINISDIKSRKKDMQILEASYFRCWCNGKDFWFTPLERNSLNENVTIYYKQL